MLIQLSTGTFCLSAILEVTLEQATTMEGNVGDTKLFVGRVLHGGTADTNDMRYNAICREGPAWRHSRH